MQSAVLPHVPVLYTDVLPPDLQKLTGKYLMGAEFPDGFDKEYDSIRRQEAYWKGWTPLPWDDEHPDDFKMDRHLATVERRRNEELKKLGDQTKRVMRVKRRIEKKRRQFT
jgi:hypothetical protein